MMDSAAQKTGSSSPLLCTTANYKLKWKRKADIINWDIKDSEIGA